MRRSQIQLQTQEVNKHQVTNMKIFLISLIAISMVLSVACSGSTGSTPKDAVRVFIEGSKNRDPEKVKSVLSRGSIIMLEQSAKTANQTLDEFIRSGVALEGLEVEDEFRNEKIDGDTATIEAKTTTGWDKIYLIKENGVWKLAVDRG